ncbi:MAG: carboxypeptidase-like regulatory domain-containing protein [Planctomycetota bacterium]
MTLLFLLVLGLSLYLAMAGDPERAPFLYPEEAPELVLTEEGGADPGAEIEVERQVSFEVRARARLLPPGSDEDLPLSLSYGEGEFPAELSVLAGAWSVPGAAGPGPQLLCLTLPAGNSIYRVHELPAPGGPSSQLELSGPVVLRGRVLDQNGAALIQARVWAGRSDAAGRLLWTDCDEDGSFELALDHGGAGIPIVAQAKGYASRYRVIPSQAAAKTLLDFNLEAAVRLEVQLAAILDDPLAGRLFLRPAAGETRLRDYPFFLHGLESGLALDDKARCRIEDLPGGVEVELVLSHAQAILPAPEKIRLTGRPKRYILQAPAAALIRGRVLDDEGDSVAGASLRCLQGRALISKRLANALLPAGALWPSGSLAFSGPEGDFALAYLATSPVDLLVQVRAAEHWGLEMQLTSTAGNLQRDFELPRTSESDGEPSIRFFHDAESAQVIRPAGGAWRVWPAGEGFEQKLREPAIVDVLLRNESRQGGSAGEVLFPGLRVTGPVDLSIELNK